VGQNIIEASWEALSDAYIYGLIHSMEVAPETVEEPLAVSA
jgi:2-isopropylmalate synthase